MNFIKQLSPNEFILTLYIKPNSKMTEIKSPSNKDESLIISIRSIAHKNKANKELIKLLKKKTRNEVKRIEMISGAKSHLKKVKIISTNPNDADTILKLLIQ